MANSGLRPLDPEGIDNTEELTMKLLYAGTSNNSDADLGPGQSYVVIREDVLALVANLTNALSVSQEFGTTISGPLSLAAMPDQISIAGGYWKINPLVLTGLPSTNATPIPWLVPSTPKLVSGGAELTSAISFLESFSDIGS